MVRRARHRGELGRPGRRGHQFGLGGPHHVLADRMGQGGQPLDDRVGTIQPDGPGGERVGDGGELGRQPFPGQGQPGPHRPAGLDPLAGGIPGDLGDPLHQFRTVAAALPGGQAALAQLVPGRLGDLPGGQHPQRVDPAAGPFHRHGHPQQVVLGQTGDRRGSSTAASSR